MRFSRTSLAVLLLSAGVVNAQEVCASDRELSASAPRIKPLVMDNGEVLDPPPSDVDLVDVVGCCVSQTCEENPSGHLTSQVIGQMPQMSEERALAILDSAKDGWKGGSGTWPQMSLGQRVSCIQKFVSQMLLKRETIIDVLMWEIGKSRKDATAEFDRTMGFIDNLLTEIRNDAEFNSSWQTIGSTVAYVRRAAIGIILCLGPFNYPLNETYATLIPALLMGNVVIVKIPTVGGLAHLLTMEAFSNALPAGAIHFVSGSGRKTMPPIMSSGSVDGLAFIGGSKAADELIRQHPRPHRLKLFLQLEAKNMGIFLPDIFIKENASVFEQALDETMTGTLSYNGQRCTALKLLFVPSQHADSFVEKYTKRVEAASVGLPWKIGESGSYSTITPLPNQKRVAYMTKLIDDAISKGAKVVNKDGGSLVGGPDSTLMVPAVLYPVTRDMDVFWEEQFGPVIPIAPYEELETILMYARLGDYGQQVSVFSSVNDATEAASLVDAFSSVFGKININTQCGRSPDSLPFSGRRSSAMGVMSIRDALREFSIPTVISYKNRESNEDVVEAIEKASRFMEQLK